MSEETQEKKQEKKQEKTQETQQIKQSDESQSIEIHNKIQTLEGEIQARDSEIKELKSKLTNYHSDNKNLLSEKNKLTEEINNVKQSIQDIHTKTAMNQIKTELLRRGFEQDEQSVILRFMDIAHKSFNMDESGNYQIKINDSYTNILEYIDQTMNELKPILRDKKPSMTTNAGMDYWKEEQEKRLKEANVNIDPRSAGSAMRYVEQLLNNMDKNNI